MMDYGWEKFHDRIIGPIIIDWLSGKISISLGVEKDLGIEIIDFRNVSIPRQLPWGMSQYINNIKCQKNDLDYWNLGIELQSGDILMVEAKQIRVNQIK
jgi:hypothetical protein